MFFVTVAADEPALADFLDERVGRSAYQVANTIALLLRIEVMKMDRCLRQILPQAEPAALGLFEDNSAAVLLPTSLLAFPLPSVSGRAAAGDDG